MLKYIIFSLSVVWFGFSYGPQNDLNIYKKVELAFKSSNSSEFSRLFTPNIDMKILKIEDVYSRTQAEIILQEFFTKNPPKEFKYLHKGNSGNKVEYAIASYVSVKGNFRVSFFMKKVKNKNLIHQLRIDQD